MKRIITGVAIAIIASFTLVACGATQPDSMQREQELTAKNQDRLSALYPVPQLETSLERDIVTQMFVLRNEARNTWSVITSDGTGTPMFDCPSIGFPIANDVRLVNPEFVAYASSYGTATLPQPEPNGLYPASSSWGTWVLCVNPDGSLNPIYNEMDTLTFPFPVTVDYETGAIKQNGAATISVELTQK